MFLRRVDVQGYRAAAELPLTCEFTGSFNLVVGANSSGKTTINEAIVHAHRYRFPQGVSIDAAVLGAPPRAVSIAYAFNDDPETEGALGQALQHAGKPAPSWSRPLERVLGRVRAGPTIGTMDGLDRLRLVYLPALRNPVDELSRRDTQILIELFRAEQSRNHGSGALGKLRNRAQGLLSDLISDQLVVDVQERIAENLRTISGGVLEHHAFVGAQKVDDAYLARVLELLLATVPDPLLARRLEASSLGYVNLLHIAVILAGIPDPAGETQLKQPESPGAANTVDSGDSQESQTDLTGTKDDADAARARLTEASEAAEADQDSFFPDLFHATVLIEEPEAHLHPQLKYGLIRYLKKVARTRRDLQIIVTTHSGELASAVEPHDLIIMRSTNARDFVSRSLKALPLPKAKRDWLFQQTRLHMDADRSGALFADQVLIVEGVTEAVLIRVIARVWAGGDRGKSAFVEALSVLPVGHAIGEWPIRVLGTPGYELVRKVAALSDTDLRGDPVPQPSPPNWQDELSPETARFFWSKPTLEPSLVAGNEALVGEALKSIGEEHASITPKIVDDVFVGHPKKKGLFALDLAARVESHPEQFQVPVHIAEIFEWLYSKEDSVTSATADA
jgi:putative ATP-dependent endonuclease of OLD family